MAYYAGFDCSTQGLSVVVIDSQRREVVYRDSIDFDPPFLPSPDCAVVHASPGVWTNALTLVMQSLGARFGDRPLGAISGSAQQHGSVYCGKTPNILTRATSPIWMDSSTGRECDEIEAALGGPMAVARLTGSRAYPRFTGPQIRKFFHDDPEGYARTHRIHLVSSFMASVLVGRHVPLDHADGSGANLMDIRARQWSAEALKATAPDLARRLPALVPSTECVGSLAESWQHRIGMPAVPVVAWSGDNPCSLVGTGLLQEGQLAISLGTSDTIFGPMNEPRVSDNGLGHVFASPIGYYMGITVFRNGSLARERVRDAFGLSWTEFSDGLARTPPGNDGAAILPWFEPEITPRVLRAGVRRFGLELASPARHVRAIVEAQAMALARHSRWMGVTPKTIYATGGAAANREILQVIADVFDADVYQFESTDSAALGAALRAYQADSRLPWSEAVDGFVSPLRGSHIRPVRAHVQVYDRLRPLYDAREREALVSPE